MFSKRNGFTLIELVLVIVILGILAVVAVPRFIDLRTQAQEAARDGVVGGVRAAISLAHAANLTGETGVYPGGMGWDTSGYPNVLDGVIPPANAGVGNELFSYILETGISDSRWRKVDADTYQYIDANNSYNYNNANGTLQQ